MFLSSEHEKSRPRGRLVLAQERSVRGCRQQREAAAVQALQSVGLGGQLGGVGLRFGLRFSPQAIVIVATGGVPDFGWLEGGEHATSAWSLVDGSAAPAERVLVYDGSGRHAAMIAAEKAQAAGKTVRLVTLDDHLCMDLTSAEQTFWKRRAIQMKLPLVFDQRLIGIARRGNALVARFSNELTNETTEEVADQIVVEQGTLPASEVYEALRAGSVNDGVTDIDALISSKPQPRLHEGKGYALHRIGDAVSSRNIHTAIYDALRLCHVM